MTKKTPQQLNEIAHTYYRKCVNYLHSNFVRRVMNITVLQFITEFLSFLCHRDSLYNDKWRKHQQLNTFTGSSG